MAAAKSKTKRKLAYTVHVPVIEENPDSGEKFTARHEVFEAGQELPDWAEAIVGDHVYEQGDDEPADDAPDES